MPSLATQPHITAGEYLALERKADHRSEYLSGRMTAMAGASRWHNLIAGNILREISRQFRGRSCEVYMGDMRVKIGATGSYTYPDVVAVCGEIHFEDALNDTLLNPTAIVEVLSASTEAYDRGEKFAHYRRLESLMEYLLVSQDKIRLEHYKRQGNQWILSELGTDEAVVMLPSIGCEVSIYDVYDKVQLGDSSKA